MLYILKLVSLLLKYKKNGMLHMLKLVCLLQKYGKNGFVVHIKTIYVYYRNTEKTCML